MIQSEESSQSFLTNFSDQENSSLFVLNSECLCDQEIESIILRGNLPDLFVIVLQLFEALISVRVTIFVLVDNCSICDELRNSQS